MLSVRGKAWQWLAATSIGEARRGKIQSGSLLCNSHLQGCCCSLRRVAAAGTGTLLNKTGCLLDTTGNRSRIESKRLST